MGTVASRAGRFCFQEGHSTKLSPQVPTCIRTCLVLCIEHPIHFLRIFLKHPVDGKRKTRSQFAIRTDLS